MDFLLHRDAFFYAGGEFLYKKRGLQMGDKLSKLLSEIVTANGTISAMREATNRGFKFSFLYKYVDDFIVGMGPDNVTTGLTLDALERTFERNIPGMGVTSETEKHVDYTWQLKFLTFTNIRAYMQEAASSTPSPTSARTRP